MKSYKTFLLLILGCLLTKTALAQTPQPCKKVELTVLSLQITRLTNEQIEFTFKIKNIGNQPIRAVIAVQAWTSYDSVNRKKSAGGRQVQLDLGVGGEMTDKMVCKTLRADCPTCPSYNLLEGMRYLILEVDSNKQVDECYKDNNVLVTPIPQ